MPNKVETGMSGQVAAERFLEENGIKIITRNYRVRSGEIDLVAKDGDFIAFVEVKYRSSLRFGYPREAVTTHKQKQIKRTALHYITRYSLTNCDFRFDVVEVLKLEGKLSINHIKNAFC